MKRTMQFILALLILLFVGCSSPTGSQSPANSSTISIEDAWVRITPMAMGDSKAMTDTNMADSMSMGAAYLTIHNSGSEADQLLKVSSDAVQMIHLHLAEEKDGMMSMHPVDAIDVPAGGDAVLKPGSYHMMLMGLTREIKPGEKITLYLTFAKAGEITTQAEARTE